jgi:hypothetical protein
MMSNDWHRSMRAMNDSFEDGADGQGTRLLLFRQQVAYHHEATKFLTKTRREYPEVEASGAGARAPFPKTAR